MVEVIGREKDYQQQLQKYTDIDVCMFHRNSKKMEIPYKIKRAFYSKNIQNSFWIIGEQVFQVLFSFVVGILSARYLGPKNYGTLNYTASFVSFFINIASLCMEVVVIKKMVDNPKDEGVYIGSCIFFRVVSSSLSMVSIAIIVYLLDPGDVLKFTLAVLQSIQLFFKSFHIFDAWFQRYLKSKYTSIGKMVASIFVSGYKLVLLVSGKSIVWFAFSNIISDLIIAIIFFCFYKKEKGPKLEIKFGTGKEVLSESRHFILSDIMSTIYMNIDKIMIGQMMGETYVGYYISAAAISAMWTFVPMALISSFRPTIIELKKNNEYLYELRLTQLLSLIIWSCVFCSVVICLLSDRLMRIVYGNEFSEGVDALKILTCSQMLAVISVARGIWILCEQKNRYVKYYVAIGTLVNIVLNTLLIPSYGIEGASVATLATSIVVLLIAPMLYRETREQTQYLMNGLLLTWLFKKRSRYEAR